MNRSPHNQYMHAEMNERIDMQYCLDAQISEMNDMSGYHLKTNLNRNMNAI